MKQSPKTPKSFSFYQIQFPFIKPIPSFPKINIPTKFQYPIKEPIPLYNSHREPPKNKKNNQNFPFVCIQNML